MYLYINILLTVIFFINIIYAIDIKNKTIRDTSLCECPLEEVPSCTCKPNTKFILPSTEMSCYCLTEILCNCMERIKKLEEQRIPLFDSQYTTNIFHTTISPFYDITTTSNYDICTVNCNKICIETCKTTPIHKQNICYDICKNTCETSCQQPEIPIHSTTYTPIHTTTVTPIIYHESEYETTLYPDIYTTHDNYPIYPSFITTTSLPNLFFDVNNNNQQDCSLQCIEKCGENFPECISACQNICECEKSCKNRCNQESQPSYSCTIPCQNICTDKNSIVINLHKYFNSRKIGMSKLNTEIKKEKNIKLSSPSSTCLIKCYQNCQVNNTLEVCSNYCPEFCNCTKTCTEYCSKRNIPHHQCENACFNTCKINNKYTKNSNNVKKHSQRCDETCYNNCNLSSKCDNLINYNSKENCKHECKKKCKRECSTQELITKCAKSENDDKFCICPNGYRSCGDNNYCCLLK
ncbi:Hypothetical protein SRAE_2000027200 [Strongyloides ratti]|uniref:Uncharacterized protein n=1 Tax=Strongyloides ratti TaxID=34506 RepID=A0A090LDJ9_STRRB|nr:Hypothetical protein SRAE_2000027200 [Strongyloides ratti]CEF65595.1 Hypothetical protein SRAE_2000027200 [Strongyloides ratti]